MAAVIVQKFGGTSVSTPEARDRVTRHVRQARDSGAAVAIVVSAMGRRGDPYATDTLLDLLRGDGRPVDRADYTMMFVTGEMIAVAVMAQHLKRAGIPAVALAGLQAGVMTDGDPTEAEILEIDTTRLRRHLERGEVPVITGGQGVARDTNDFNTLGRGASDTSGVAVGVALRADRVDIFTDVNGVASADPRAVPDAVFRDRIGFERMHALARFGAKVVHPRAILAGWRSGTPLLVRSTFADAGGTWIGPVPDEPPFTGVATLQAMSSVTVPAGRVPDDLLATWERRRLIMSVCDRATGALVLGGPDERDLTRALQEAGVSVERQCGELAWVTVVGDEGALAARADADCAILAGAGAPARVRAGAGSCSTYLVDPRHAPAAAATLHAAYAAPAATRS